jgi:hypothetical protein
VVGKGKGECKSAKTDKFKIIIKKFKRNNSGRGTGITMEK